MWKTGLVSISFRNLSTDEIMKLARDAGLDAIEWGSDVHAPYEKSEKLEEIAQKQSEYGLYCSSYGTYFRLGLHDTALLKDYIKAAKILKTNILRIWCGNKNFQELSEDERKHIICEGQKAAKLAKEANVFLCMECHNNTYTNCIEGAIDLMTSINSKHFLMYWQPNQYQSFEKNCEYARLIAPYVVNIHAFYWEGKNRYKLADGLSMWKSYLSYFHNEGVIMLEFMPDDDPKSLKEEANALNMLVNNQL